MAPREWPHSPRCAKFARSAVAEPPRLQREVFGFALRPSSSARPRPQRGEPGPCCPLQAERTPSGAGRVPGAVPPPSAARRCSPSAPGPRTGAHSRGREGRGARMRAEGREARTRGGSLLSSPRLSPECFLAPGPQPGTACSSAAPNQSGWQIRRELLKGSGCPDGIPRTHPYTRPS